MNHIGELVCCIRKLGAIFLETVSLNMAFFPLYDLKAKTGVLCGRSHTRVMLTTSMGLFIKPCRIWLSYAAGFYTPFLWLLVHIFDIKATITLQLCSVMVLLDWNLRSQVKPFSQEKLETWMDEQIDGHTLVNYLLALQSIWNLVLIQQMGRFMCFRRIECWI